MVHVGWYTGLFRLAEILGFSRIQGPVRGHILAISRITRSAGILGPALTLGLFLAGVLCLPAQGELFAANSFTLANGLQVVVIENHRSPVVAQMLFYRAGGADAPVGKSGIAHFLEHLMFNLQEFGS